MKELFRTNDVVHLSWASSLLEAHGIATLILDEHASSIEGSISAIPRRLMVEEGDVSRAKWLLSTADPGPIEPD